MLGQQMRGRALIDQQLGIQIRRAHDEVDAVPVEVGGAGSAGGKQDLLAEDGVVGGAQIGRGESAGLADPISRHIIGKIGIVGRVAGVLLERGHDPLDAFPGEHGGAHPLEMAARCGAIQSRGFQEADDDDRNDDQEKQGNDQRNACAVTRCGRNGRTFIGRWGVALRWHRSACRGGVERAAKRRRFPGGTFSGIAWHRGPRWNWSTACN